MKFILGCALCLLIGCTQLNIENPFQSTASPNEVYYEHFTDIPIPRDLSLDLKRCLVSVSQDGSKIGLVTVEGRVDLTSLTRAMISNMQNQGWQLVSMSSGHKTVQLYEKDGRYAILYYYEQTTNSAMEIWVSLRQEGLASSYTAPPAFNSSPATSSSAGSGNTIMQQGLSQ